MGSSLQCRPWRHQRQQGLRLSNITILLLETSFQEDPDKTAACEKTLVQSCCAGTRGWEPQERQPQTHQSPPLPKSMDSIVSIRLVQHHSCSAGSMRRDSSQDSQDAETARCLARETWTSTSMPLEHGLNGVFIAHRSLLLRENWTLQPHEPSCFSHHAHIHKHVVQHPITCPYVCLKFFFRDWRQYR